MISFLQGDAAISAVAFFYVRNQDRKCSNFQKIPIRECYTIREFVENKLPKFCEVIFSLVKAKNVDIAVATARLFNAE